MFIDVSFIVVMIFAVFKGLQRGLIIGVFSILAFIIGLAAALKLAAVVAVNLRGTVNVSSKWLPVLSFLLVFILVVFLVRWGAKLLEATVKFALLGWLNRLCGVILYTLLYTIIFSIILFFIVQLRIINEVGVGNSKTYPYIAPVGPIVIDNFARLIPLFKNMFTELQQFFENLSKRLS